MRQRIKLGFADFWPSFNHRDNYFTQLLAPDFDIEVSDQPDYLIYSVFGKSFRNHRCTRIYYTGENKRPNFRECDYAFSFDYCMRPDHYRLPLYALYDDPAKLTVRPPDPEQVLAGKTRFCNFIYSNRKCQVRNKFFEMLARYKRVDSAGRWLNNMGGAPLDDKRNFIRDYKFTIAFENGSFPGYTTEKIFEPLLENSLAIYWGNPLVHLDFNPRSFINYYDYGSLEALLDWVIEVDQNDDLYCQYFRQPCFHNNVVNQFVCQENVREQFARIFASSKTPIARLARFQTLSRNRHVYAAA